MNLSNTTNLLEKWNIDPNKPMGLIFDVDELLCQNSPEIYLAYKMLLDGRGIPLEKGEKFPGKDLFEIVNNIKCKYCIDASIETLVAERRKHYLKIIKENEVACSEGVKELFQFLEQFKCEGNIRIAYTSSSEHAFINVLLSKLFHQCELYDYVENPDSFFYHANGLSVSTCWKEGLNKKPAPDLYQMTLANLKLENQQCIAVEDSLSGFQSAQSTGLRVIVIPSESQRDNFLSSEWDVIHDDHVKFHSLTDVYNSIKTFYEHGISKV